MVYDNRYDNRIRNDLLGMLKEYYHYSLVQNNSDLEKFNILHNAILTYIRQCE